MILSKNKKTMKNRTYVVYLLSNSRHTVLYCGITSDLVTRIWQHKCKMYKGFTQKYKVTELLYFEKFEYVTDAINREKQIKGMSKQKKWAMIDNLNKGRQDLFRLIL